MSTAQWKQDNAEKMREYRRRWYRENKEHAKKRVSQRKAELQNWFNELKRKLRCSCGESHPACLDFHHTNPKEKDIILAHAPNSGWSKERILAEIEKCIVLCANCHRKLHSEGAIV